MGPNFNRRSLLGLVAGITALAARRAEARTIAKEIPWNAGDANNPTPVSGDSYEFLSRDEASFLEAALASCKEGADICL